MIQRDGQVEFALPLSCSVQILPMHQCHCHYCQNKAWAFDSLNDNNMLSYEKHNFFFGRAVFEKVQLKDKKKNISFIRQVGTGGALTTTAVWLKSNQQRSKSWMDTPRFYLISQRSDSSVPLWTTGRDTQPGSNLYYVANSKRVDCSKKKMCHSVVSKQKEIKTLIKTLNLSLFGIWSIPKYASILIMIQ